MRCRRNIRPRHVLSSVLCPMPRPGLRAKRCEQTSRTHKLAPKAVERLADDWERLVTFYQLPREHWPHLRTTNVIETSFATVRLRTTAAKRFKKIENATALIWKMLQVAESTFRRLKGAEFLPAVYAGAQYGDGVQRTMSEQKKLAA
jgi:putative transposase